MNDFNDSGIIVGNKEIEDIVKCTECGCSHLVRDYERGELVCEECGLVLDEKVIDQGPDWREFENDDTKVRAGPPSTPTIHDRGLPTTIDPRNRDAHGKSIPSKQLAQVYRLRQWQKRIRVSNAAERNLATALSEMEKMASSMGLPRNVRETAATIYRWALDKNLIRGRSIEGVVSAALYAACRQCNVPRTLDEIASFSRISRKEIGRTYRFVSRELQLKLVPTSPQDYISRFCSELRLSNKTEVKAREILQRADELELTSGRGPTGIAAASIYIATILCNERRTQREVADVSGITEVTVRNRYKDVADCLGLDLEIYN